MGAERFLVGGAGLAAAELWGGRFRWTGSRGVWISFHLFLPGLPGLATGVSYAFHISYCADQVRGALQHAVSLIT